MSLRHELARMLRAVADRLDPPPVPVPDRVFHTTNGSIATFNIDWKETS